MARAGSRDGRWAYTLYSRSNGRPFVHALHTTRREAFCIDIPSMSDDRLSKVRMRVGKKTIALRVGGKTIATIDTRTFEVKG
jgi:hypothetical protein